MKTDVIRYNLAERGRTYRGKDRNFDIPRIKAVINGPACQEKVRHRDMLGYYGHWPRIKFGMNPAEGGVVDGKCVSVQPALVTTFLKAYDDGTIEHQAEFLDTSAGKAAAGVYASKAGGFSSAIDEYKPEFFGFDYVLEPNYSTNRGYEFALDSLMTLDAVEAVAAYDQHVQGMALLLDCVQADRMRADRALRNAIMALDAVTVENEHLMSILMQKTPTLDSLESVPHQMPIFSSTSKLARMKFDIDGFKTAELARLDIPEEKPDTSVGHILDRVTNR